MKIQRSYLFILLFFSIDLVVRAQTDSLINRTDAGNMKQGYQERLYPNGKPMYQGYFKDDLPVGEMKRYYESGNLQAILNYDEKGDYVRAMLFYEDGSRAAEGLYFNMLKDSTWKYYSYYNNVLTAEESYDKGKLDGPVCIYYSDGNISERIEWEKGVKNGAWMQYFNNGNLKLKGTFKEGMREGAFFICFEDGSPLVTGSYLNDQPHGLWTFYNEDGSVASELNYENGINLDEKTTDEMQDELFKRIEENMGKFEEPDEMEFLMPSGR